MKRFILAALGIISLSLGVLGIILPVLPTTPFLLLASYLFLKSSLRLHDWLIHHRILGSYIYNYITYRAIPKKTKVLGISVLWATLSVSIYIVSHPYVTAVLVLVGTGVTIHLLKMKTLTSEERLRTYREAENES
jgi:uncharacterized membrane protein YbaN (DUF454 family)